MASMCILVVFDPTSDAQPALERAAALAKNARSAEVKLHVYSCIYTKIPKSEGKAVRKKLLAAQKEIVTNAVSGLVGEGIPVNIEVEWGKDWYKAVVRTADRVEADAVFKSTHKHSPSQRLLKKTSDRTLLRQCECPVLLVKSDARAEGSQRVLLAAVHFRGEAGAYANLNKRIMDFAKLFFTSETAQVHFVNAYTGLSDRPDKGQLVRACGVPSDQVHIRVGETDDVIIDTARELDAYMVVIGNSARTGLAALINTNTAERVLDKLDCHLLALP